MKFIVLFTLIFVAVVASPIVEDIAPAFDAFRDTEFWLFTRQNPTVRQVLDLNDMSTVLASNWDTSRPTRVIIHGQLSDGTSDLNTVLTAAYLRNGDFNVVVVDWGAGANTINYITARNQVGNVGHVIAVFLDNLNAANLMDFGRLTVACHSLGGHVGGFVGKRVTRGRVNTIIGMNPAGPLFDVNNPAERLDFTDAEYVEVIHTESSTFGIEAPIGHVNFYPNGGHSQPGCILNSCDHGRSFLLYAESLNSDRLWGRRCDSMDEMERNACTGPGFSMGGEPSNYNLGLRGIFRLNTAGSSPFGLGPF